MEFFLAKSEYFTDEVRFEEWLAAADIEFFHSCLREETETLLGLV